MTKTIYDVFGAGNYNQVKPWTTGKVVPLASPSPTLLYGAELEIENTDAISTTSGFRAVEDGSLRNFGREYISSPMTYSNLVWCLDQFFAKNKIRSIMESEGVFAQNSNYSERTSIHVHTNCQDLTMDQLATLCMVYETFERVLFGFVGNHRDKNIFCVPWYETNLSHQAVLSIKENNLPKLKMWQKYTALNLLPLFNQGTIEWRHLHGTSDVELIKTWLRLIGWIYVAAMNHQFEDLQQQLTGLNTTSQYDRVLDMVFRDDADALRLPGYQFELECGVLDMKYTLMRPQKAAQAGPFGEAFLRLNEERQRIRRGAVVAPQEQVVNAHLAGIGPAGVWFAGQNVINGNQIVFDDIVEDWRTM